MSIFSSDFRKFDRQAAQAYLILHNELNQQMNICAGGSLKIPLNIDTFLRVKHDTAVFVCLLSCQPRYSFVEGHEISIFIYGGAEGCEQLILATNNGK